MTSSLQQEITDLLSAGPTRASLFKLVSRLDLACSSAPPDTPPPQILARAIVAVGQTLYEKLGYATIANTLQAAEWYVLEPTAENFATYQRAATNSYPFGSGDGCYAVAETGYTDCQPGSGCSSGAGSLCLIGMDETAVLALLRKELLPWLQGESDPVAARWL
ncbi:MAG: hypothetical protein KDE04_25545, partial [Anaerolineales bacterium]|nr:hypothetical protein [Anaerolineales bacterium]